MTLVALVVGSSLIALLDVLTDFPSASKVGIWRFVVHQFLTMAVGAWIYVSGNRQ